MDYTTQPFMLKARKLRRYVRLYGVRRTHVKARSYYHMRRRYSALPPVRTTGANGRHVAIVGCGKYAFAQVAYFLRKNFGDVVYGAMDVDIHRAASLFEHYDLVTYTDDAASLISDPAVDTVFVASNHASHADYAIMALGFGKSVHIEKPHVTNEDQLRRLCAAMAASSGRVTLGFNRPLSPLGREIAGVLEAEEGPSLLSWFVKGHQIEPDHWYFDKEEGGRILGNLCHWTDLVYRLVPPAGRYPIEINPTRGTTPDSDLAVSYTFGDGSIASIVFSTHGEAFDGIRERFAANRGEALVTMDDFRTLEVQIGDRRRRITNRHRDHGHEALIRDSYRVGRGEADGATTSYVWETGELFLKTREAFERDERVTVEPFDRARLDRDAAGHASGRR